MLNELIERTKEGHTIRHTPIIRLFERSEDGKVFDLGQELDMPEVCGTVPAVGDIISDSLAPANADRRNPENRRLYEVVGRYFLPRPTPVDNPPNEMNQWVALVVKTRKATWEEIDIINN